jgi:uncharacterized membrane protein
MPALPGRAEVPDAGMPLPPTARPWQVAAVPPTGDRKLWLDWQRGLAVVYMVIWHTWDSWRADAGVPTLLHDWVNLIGGMAAPSFLYMAGLSQVLADGALARKGVPADVRRARTLRRGAWLLAVAYLFRVAEYVLGGAYRVPGAWQHILRVDVLNVIAVSFLLSALFTVGVDRRIQVVAAVGSTALVVFLAPVVAAWKHDPSHFLDYLYSEWPRGIFHLFPWAGFLFAGSVAGALAASRWRFDYGPAALRSARTEAASRWRFDDAGRAPGPIVWLALGVLLVVGGWAADKLPPFYAHQDFWKTSPSWFAMRLGFAVATSGALQLVPAFGDRWLAWLRLIGRHSLLGYFVSVEIPYGRLSDPLHRRLGPQSLLLGVGAMLLLTFEIARVADRYDDWRAGRGREGATARRTGGAVPSA